MAHAFLFVEMHVQVVQRCKKVPWPDRKTARKIAGNSRRVSGLTACGTGTLQVYKCEICGGWHTGHNGK